jgi:hypothetical protein
VREYRDPRVPIRVALGREFSIVLPADPRSGLSWRPAPVPDRAVLLSIGTTFRAAGRRIEQVLLYGGVGYGTTAVTLHYVGPRATDHVQRTVSFTVTVYNPLIPTTTATTSTTVPTTTIGGAATSPTSYVPTTATPTTAAPPPTTPATPPPTRATTSTTAANTTTTTTKKP